MEISNPRKLYFKYFFSSFLSSLIPCLFGVVDMGVIGRYYGPIGTSSLAVASPVWNLTFTIGILFGLGGAISFTKIKAESLENTKRANEIFTTSIILVLIFGILLFLGCLFFEEQILYFFGADSETLPIAKEYLKVLRFAIPFFGFNEVLSSFIRNDNRPLLTTLAVGLAGIFNIGGDFILTFRFDMGANGSGTASACGAFVATIVLLSHFLSKKNTIKLVLPKHFIHDTWNTIKNGFASSFADFSMGIVTIIFNNQIKVYFDNNALSIYGTIINAFTIITCISYSIGNSSQPIISYMYGKRDGKGIKQIVRYASFTALIFGIISLVLLEIFPIEYISIFMEPTSEVNSIASYIIRIYSISFYFIPFNIFATYFFPSVLKPHFSTAISFLRGLIFPALFVYILPLIFSKNSIWFVMPIVECLIGIFALTFLEIDINKKELFPNK